MMDEADNDHMIFYPPDWDEQMRQFYRKQLPQRPFTVERKKKHLPEYERRRRALRIVE